MIHIALLPRKLTDWGLTTQSTNQQNLYSTL